MQPANNFIVLNIREYLENGDKRLGEETLVQLLSEFSCLLNPDVERFLSVLIPDRLYQAKRNHMNLCNF